MSKYEKYVTVEFELDDMTAMKAEVKVIMKSDTRDGEDADGNRGRPFSWIADFEVLSCIDDQGKKVKATEEILSEIQEKLVDMDLSEDRNIYGEL